ncbi:hypothetical protein [Mucilaginibacter gotjawali]|uniref:Uncharacterized protein n=2 Tax=Mucilaginibacter gotjawali TaxID=1550579 RepID=A0A839SQ44_9SPHI|nr:hypothetical protein [Mucilaginibacter gotjawali]MBB3058589.1 hypothetical protein [Mucilaginibacter gotjawali]BAU52444.1 hypothetical protein MgSA37_00605 [Mucilaginibacter gotjawali]
MSNSTKPPLKKIVLCLFIGFTAFACKKTVQKPVVQVTGTASTFKIDGTAVKIDSASAMLYTNASGRQMDIYAYKGGQEVLEFHFDPKTGNKTAGTTLGSGAFLTYMASPVLSYDSQSGALNVTVCDTIGKKVEADFNFVAKQYPYTDPASKTITEGHISITKINKQ